jgi:hypothetical protein
LDDRIFASVVINVTMPDHLLPERGILGRKLALGLEGQAKQVHQE